MVRQEKSRTCGECSLCCFTHGVSTSARRIKKAGEWCRYCGQGRGCKIYDARPIACNDFSCAWLDGEGGDWERPDLVGVVTEWLSFPHLGRVLRLSGATPESLDSSYVVSRAVKYANVFCPVLICHLARRWEICLAEHFLADAYVRATLMLLNATAISPCELEERL